MSPRQERNPVLAFLGWLLMGIGGLIVVTAGACTAIFAVPAMLSSFQYPEGLPQLLFMVFLFGGVPILVGIGLFVGGRAMAGRVRRLPPRRVEDFEDRP
ncbi:hypothetical protein [Brevundimonas sp.]|uniref:hypothetical protein n=1 Tax=Brevundimonas sp. TaxID=1871086 RepID=UPI002ABC4E85|nr:hypothetical protein [Brevundimonas sp.]MDZ4364487.1 hypothetical protein [Brevundimonas sp.]